MTVAFQPRCAALVVACLSLVACVDEGDGPSTDDSVDQSCSDRRYGDGLCQLVLDCDVPDIDCFTTFKDDTAAAAWLTRVEQSSASTGDPPREVLPVTDPRYAPLRALLDRGWQEFRRVRPVGRLAERRPALVLVDATGPKAFAMRDPESERSAFAVVVDTALVFEDDASRLATMIRELQHATALHVLAGGRDRVRRYYVAPVGFEPIGRLQAEEARAREHGEAWRKLARDVGPDSTLVLGGLPVSGWLLDLFSYGLAAAHQANPAGCTRSGDVWSALWNDLADERDPIDGSIAIPQDTLATRVDAALTQLRDDCFATFGGTFVEVLAAMKKISVEEAEALLSPQERAAVANKNFFVALTEVIAGRRASMRAIEAAFETKTGQPWSQLRYFSFEEEADDVTVPVLRGAGFKPSAYADVLASQLDMAAFARCDALLRHSGMAPPYGIDLLDERHATCWRIAHIEQLAAP